MTIKRIIKASLHLSCILALVVSVAGCIKEDVADCPDVYTLVVKAYDNAGVELGTDEVREAVVFVFDKDFRFAYKIETDVKRSVAIKAPAGEDLHVVAWGNLKGGMQTWTEPEPGDLLDDCFAALLPDPRATAFALSPGDLFRGDVTVSRADRNGEKVLPIYREAGSMTITVRGMKTFTGHYDNDYWLTVSDTYSAIGFGGLLSGGRVSYRPQGSFATIGGKEEYIVPAFNLLPESVLRVDIYHGSQLVATVSKSNGDTPIVVEKGRQTNVLIELRASVNVSMEIDEWGGNPIWKEF